MEFKLDNIKKQEEYDITLDILDEGIESKINATIYSKIIFIWSNFQYYNDLFLKSEALVNSYKSILDKSNLYLDNLNDPFNFVSDTYNTDEINNQEIVNPNELKQNNMKDRDINSYKENKNNFQKFNANPNNKNESLDHLFNKSSKLNGDNVNKNNMNQITLIRIVLYILLLISILNSPVYSEMFNTLISVIMIGIVSTSRIKQDLSYYMGVLIQLGASLIVYDLVYLFFHTGSSQIEGWYVYFLYGLNGLGFLFKIGLVISFIIIKVKTEKTVNKNGSNSNNIIP